MIYLHTVSKSMISFPFSQVQQASWFFYQLNPHGLNDKLSFALKFNSSVDINKITLILQKLVNYYPSLRTVYQEKEGELIQSVLETVNCDLEIINSNAAELESYLITTTQKALNLEKGEVIRGTLLKVSSQESILVITIHKVAVDNSSLWTFVEQFINLYKEDLTDLPNSAQSYQEFVNLEEDYLASKASEIAAQYWQETLSGELPILELPTRLSRPPLRTYKGSVHHLNISDSLTQQLQQLAEQNQVSLQTLLLAAFKVLLYRYTSEEDLILACQTSQKYESKHLEQLGNYGNLVSLRNCLDRRETFSQFLHRVNQKKLEVSEYENYPFSLLAQKLQGSSKSSYPPISPVSFAFHDLKTYAHLSNLFSSTTHHRVLEYFKIPEQSVEFDLSLEVLELQQSLLLQFKYNSDLLEAETIIQLAQHFQNLLTGIIEYPQSLISQLPLLNESEKEQILYHWNNTQKDYDLSRCLHHWVEDQIEKNPEAIAVIFENQHLTYQQLNERANQLAHFLQELGVKSEILVGICVERSLEMVIGLLAILKAGGAYVPLDPGYPQDRLTYMLEDSQIPVLLTQEKLINQLPKTQGRVIYLDRDWKNISNYPTHNPSSDVTPNNLAYVMYTSGSTGKPKGVMLTHRGIVNRLLWMQEHYQMTPEDRVLQKTPFSFDLSIWEFFWTLMSGARLIVAKPEGHKDSAYLVNIIAEHKITYIHFVPSMLQIFLEEEGLDRCSSLKRVICGGEALPFSLQQRFFGRLNCELHNLYGPTEAVLDVTYWQCKADTDSGAELVAHLNIVPIGRPIANTQIYILDEYLQPVPVGVAGELHIGGVQVARGYLNRPELTAQKFICDPFNPTNSQRLYKTGDLARYLPDGNIEYIRRLDFQVKIRGFRIELGEIEQVLSQYPGVRETVVISRSSKTGEQKLIAYLVPTEKILPSQVRSFLQQRLPDYMIPAAFISLESLPLTPNGKLNRRALPEPDLSSFTDHHEIVAPRNEIEEKLAQIWSQLLHLDPISVKDNFFELGGHSLLAIKLMGQIKQQFQRNFPLATLLTTPTIEQLAQLLEQDTKISAYSPLVPIQPKGNKAPFFCVHPAGGHVLCYVKLAQYLGNDQPFYGLQAQGFNEGEEALTTVQDMASLYVQAIRKFQPEGPYQVGGWSFGGVVAYEIAQQLHQQGQQVSRLAILDSYVPILLDKNKKIDDVYMVGVLSRYLGGIFGQDNLVTPEELTGLSVQQQIDYIIDKARQLDIFPKEDDKEKNRRFLDVLVGTLKATYFYQRQPYPGKVIVFRATEKHIMAPDPQLVWVELFSILDAPEIDLVKVPGHHYSFILEPHVQVLAQHLSRCLTD